LFLGTKSGFCAQPRYVAMAVGGARGRSIGLKRGHIIITAF